MTGDYGIRSVQDRPLLWAVGNGLDRPKNVKFGAQLAGKRRIL